MYFMRLFSEVDVDLSVYQVDIDVLPFVRFHRTMPCVKAQLQLPSYPQSTLTLEICLGPKCSTTTEPKPNRADVNIVLREDYEN